MEIDNPQLSIGPDSGTRAGSREARVHRLLLEQVRFAITTEPAAVEAEPAAPPESLTNIRGRVSITVGTIVVRLNREGFTQSDHLYSIRDVLAAGQPVANDDLEWLNMTIARESGPPNGLGGFQAS